MFNVELMSLIGGGFVGFLFRFLAEKRETEKENFQRVLSMIDKSKEVADAAVQRVPLDIGRITRRLIVICVLFSSILAPFIAPLFGLSTYIETNQNNPQVLFGLIPEISKKVFVELQGFVYTQEMKQTLMAIIGFYFGSASASNKS
jgi:hypothetical protein